MFLLDTNIVSELSRPRPARAVFEWIESQDRNALFVSAVTIGELARGAEMLRERDPSRATVIEQWVEGIATSYTCLPMDVASFRLWARLTARRADRLALDAMIAATALTRGLIVATRNVRDFRALGVPTVNPFRARG